MPNEAVQAWRKPRSAPRRRPPRPPPSAGRRYARPAAAEDEAAEGEAEPEGAEREGADRDRLAPDATAAASGRAPPLPARSAPRRAAACAARRRPGGRGRGRRRSPETVPTCSECIASFGGDRVRDPHLRPPPRRPRGARARRRARGAVRRVAPRARGRERRSREPRARIAELERARTLLDRLSAPWLAVPGNHDIPYTLPARVTRPWARFEDGRRHDRPGAAHRARGRLRAQLRPPVAPSGRPPRRRPTRIARPHPRDRPGRRAAHRRLPSPPGRRALARVAEVPAQAPRRRDCGRWRRPAPSSCSEGTSTRARRSSGTRSRPSDDDPGGSLVLSTAPGFGRPRPHRLGEANGLHVIRWSPGEVLIETRTWREWSVSRRLVQSALLVWRGC